MSSPRPAFRHTSYRPTREHAVGHHCVRPRPAFRVYNRGVFPWWRAHYFPDRHRLYIVGLSAVPLADLVDLASLVLHSVNGRGKGRHDPSRAMAQFDGRSGRLQPSVHLVAARAFRRNWADGGSPAGMMMRARQYDLRPIAGRCGFKDLYLATFWFFFVDARDAVPSWTFGIPRHLFCRDSAGGTRRAGTHSGWCRRLLVPRGLSIEGGHLGPTISELGGGV